MKKRSINYKTILFVTGLILLSVIIFLIQLLIFHNPEESEFLIFQDLMFLPIHIVLITFILDSLIKKREKKERILKNNTLINEFYSEAGEEILRCLNDFRIEPMDIEILIEFNTDWIKKDFINTERMIDNLVIKLSSDKSDLNSLYDTLSNKKQNILSMLENQNIIEHDEFADMLWATYHVLDELRNRKDLDNLPAFDHEHLSNDLTRAYKLMLRQYILYIMNLKNEYPYLFSMKLRKRLFAQNIDVTVRK